MKSEYLPSGDQPKAIQNLLEGIEIGKKNQLLLGITGSGKTFSIANVIYKSNLPSLIIAPNKTIASQLYEEMKNLFPENAVEFFVSYYDYYQPEAYVPRTDTFIEKDSSINERIDRLRHSATISMLKRKDFIIISSVSCIYGIGAPENYLKTSLNFFTQKIYCRKKILLDLVRLQYKRDENNFLRGCFRIRSRNIDIFPCHYEDIGIRLSFNDDVLENIFEFDVLNMNMIRNLDKFSLFGASHYITPKEIIEKSIKLIKKDLDIRISELKKENKILECDRLKHRVKMDIEMLETTGFCKGIENYSRYINNSLPGSSPVTLFHYLPENALCFVDESHITVPQIAAMYNGDYSRKRTLVDYGFRLPSALDNRPLKFAEWDKMRNKTIFVSATPSEYEMNLVDGKYVEQIIRPTGLLDPLIIVKPIENQVEDLITEIKKTITKGNRILVITLTKKMSESLTEYLIELNYKVSYLHSEVKTLDRIKIINNLRLGKIDIIVGINLLREGLDIPECSLVAILDADKEGFLRSERSLMQTIGRAARNSEGRVILYADKETNSMKKAILETNRRRKMQEEYNKINSIEPKTVKKSFSDRITSDDSSLDDNSKMPKNIFRNSKVFSSYIKEMRDLMLSAAKDLNFESAKKYRDKIKFAEEKALTFFNIQKSGLNK